MLQSQHVDPRIDISKHLQVLGHIAIQNGDKIHPLLFIQHEIVNILDKVDDHLAELNLVSEFLCVLFIAFNAIRMYKVLVVGI